MSQRLFNDNALLVTILQRMYNDNIRQLNNLTSATNSIRNTNNQIRNQLYQILYSQNSYYRRNSRFSNREANDREFIVDGTPYVLENIPSTERESRFMQNFLRPVEVFPTTAQIEVATRNVVYSSIVNPINVACPISLENFNNDDVVSVIRYCGHIFKPEDLTIWFRSNCSCPVCRYDIRNYNNESIEENQHRISDPSNNTTTIPLQSTQNLLTTYLDIFLENGAEPLLNEANTILTLLSRRR